MKSSFVKPLAFFVGGTLVLGVVLFLVLSPRLKLPFFPRGEDTGRQNSPPGPIVFGAQIDPNEISDVCSSAQNLGVKATIVWIGLGEFEPERGVFRFDNFDNRLKPYFDCGLDVGLHVQLKGARWAGSAGNFAGNRATGQAGAAQKKRMQNQTIPPPQDVYNAAYQLAGHFKGKIHFYSLENEANSPSGWSSTPESYFELLNSFTQGIKAADPSNVVEDSGTGGTAYGIIIASQLLQNGKQEEAVNFANHYYEHFGIGDELINISSVADLNTFLSEPVPSAGLKSTSAWMPLLSSSSAQYDRIQIHYYAPWDLLPTVFNYVKTGMEQGGKVRPIDIWELGYGWSGYGLPSQNGYNPSAHAQDTVKLLTIAAGEGANRIIYWRFTDTSHKKPTNDQTSTSRTPGLVKNGTPNQAGIAYKVTVSKLAGATSAQRVNVGNPNVWIYKFVNNGKNIFVVWSTSPATVNLNQAGFSATEAIITNIDGSTSSQNPNTLSVGVSPIFVE